MQGKFSVDGGAEREFIGTEKKTAADTADRGIKLKPVYIEVYKKGWNAKNEANGSDGGKP